MANKTLFALMFLCSYALVLCILGLESVALVALWLKNPLNQRYPRLMNYCKPATGNWQLYSTTVEDSLQISSFMQNKPNFLDDQMNVSPVITAEYENETLSERGKKQSQTKPNSKRPK